MSKAVKLELEDRLADDIRAVAELCEMSVEDYILLLLKREAKDAADSLGWNHSIEEDLAALRDFDETGLGVPGEEVSAWLDSLSTDNPLPRPKPRKIA